MPGVEAKGTRIAVPATGLKRRVRPRESMTTTRVPRELEERRVMMISGPRERWLGRVVRVDREKA